MIIYENDEKCLEMKRSQSSNRYEFYLDRDGNTYKMKTLNLAIDHIYRNLHGFSRIRVMGRLLIVVVLSKLSLN